MQNANAKSKFFRSENDQKKGSVDLKSTFGQKLVEALDDSNDSTEISQAGVFDLCDRCWGKYCDGKLQYSNNKWSKVRVNDYGQKGKVLTYG